MSWVDAAVRLRASLRTRAALGLRPATSPVMVLLPAGILVGPLGANILSVETLAHLDVVISIALATLGVFVGIAIGTQRSAVKRVLAAAAAEGIVTALTVAVATYILLVFWNVPLLMAAGLAAAALGVAASASAAPWVGDPDDGPRRTAARVADLDDVLPMVLGGIVLSLAVAGWRDVFVDFALSVGAGLGVGLASWLLLERSEGAERGVFVVGTLALLGGCAAYLGVSALLIGLVTGLVWAWTPGHTDRIAGADLRKVQHPLVVLLLITAGAGLQPTLEGIWLFAPYVVFRMAGKLLGGWAAARVVPEVASADLGALLISPGVVGIAFVLNLQQVAPAVTAPLVLAVALGAIASELVAVILTPAPRMA